MATILARFLLGVGLLFGFLVVPSLGHSAEGDAEFSVSPDSAYPALTRAIKDARSSIKINIYMLTNKVIVDQLVGKARSGLEVTILVEGQPNGGAVLPAVKALLEHMNQSFEQNSRKAKILVMTGESGKRRYVYDHAKYAIIDNRMVFVSSDNFTNSAFPVNNRIEGGTRGWQVRLENRKLARELSKIFKKDTDLKNPDVKLYKDSNLKVRDPNDGNSVVLPIERKKERRQELFNTQLGKVKSAKICASPKSAPCVIEFIRSAKSELLVEHLSLPEIWFDFENKTRSKNLILEEYIAAAKRGVHVRILLNDESVFSGNEDKDEESKNSTTVKDLNIMAKRMKIPLEASLFNAKNLGVSSLHNKGMVADGERAFVSSINGTENSVDNNREMALALDSVDGARYYSEVFEYDWKMSGN